MYLKLSTFISSPFILLSTIKASEIFLYYVISLQIYYHHQRTLKADEYNLISSHSG